MNVDYIVVQAGGKGKRMDYLTRNKPKALVPIENLPMIFHLFRKYPEKKYIIIGDYKIDVLNKYLEAFAKVNYCVVNACGAEGTCSGLKDAINIMPDKNPFMLIWSDLILPEEFELPEIEADYLGLSKDFSCRWLYKDGQFREESSANYGVAGLFVFKDKNKLMDVPASGELVKWFQSKSYYFETLDLYKTKEYGLLEEVNQLERKRCRPFNQIRIENGRLIKEGIDLQGRGLAVREKAWYKEIAQRGFTKVPAIYDFEPLTMELIDGKNVFEYDFTKEEKWNILNNIIASLKELHTFGEQESDYFSLQEAYVKKTWDRLDIIRNLVPFANEKEIVINGKKCRNIFFNREWLEERFNQYLPKKFYFLHGDCTFSNIMLKEGNEVVLIDPRGYFGTTEIFGDAVYDWAKLYYSIVGNYDQFNLKNFSLEITQSQVNLTIASNGWEDMEEAFFALIGEVVRKEDICLIHSVIWLSLTTYAWEDYDSICGAFYNGLYYMEDCMNDGIL